MVCGALAAVGLGYGIPAALMTGIYFGYFATMGAILVALFVGGSAAARALSGAAKPYIERHWLALANGAVSLAFYALVVTRL